jgi:hypothetical protein
MTTDILKCLTLLPLLSLCGCQSYTRVADPAESIAPSASSKKSVDLTIRNNSWALLNDLLNQEKHVSTILIIKRESPELNRLIKDISETAAEAAKRMQALAKKDPALELATIDLPPGEAATRKAVSKTKEHALLSAKDAEFEFQLLLTQAEALSYGAHLALVIAENEPQDARAREFSDLSARLTQLYEQVIARLRNNKG